MVMVLYIIIEKIKKKCDRNLTFTKFPSVPGGRGHSIPGLISESGHALHLLRSGNPNEITEVTRDIMQTSKICDNEHNILTSSSQT